jgi:hypothetical protein
MHNNFGFILSNPVFSVSCLMFYPYHSWIDAMLEMKLRRSNQSKGDVESLRSTLNNKYTALVTQKNTKIYRTHEDDYENIFKTMKNDRHVSGDDDIPTDTAGIYPVLEWISPDKKK